MNFGCVTIKGVMMLLLIFLTQISYGFLCTQIDYTFVK